MSGVPGHLDILATAATLDRKVKLNSNMNIMIIISVDSSSWSTPRVLISSLSFLTYLVLLVLLVKIIRLISNTTKGCLKLFKKDDKNQAKQLSEFALKSMK